MPAKPPHFSPKQVAMGLEVSESSIKRWCDRGEIPTIRTSGGHRRITLDGLYEFLQATDRSLKHPDLLGLPQLPRARKRLIPGGDQPFMQRFRDALAAGDESTCRQIIQNQLENGWKRFEAAEDLISDAMRGLGAAWDCSDIDIYQERVGCKICTRLINELRSELPIVETDAPVAVGGATSGDRYDLATALVELTLRESGWNATNLGCDLPLDSILQAAHDHQASLVWLSVSVIDDESSFVSQQNTFANSLPDDVSLIIGGRALNDDIRPKLLYTAHCDSLRHLVGFAEAIR